MGTSFGIDFEYYCADLLKSLDYSFVEVTQASGDQGIDVLATKDNVTYAIQCKCYEGSVGNDAVQQAYAGAGYYKCDVAMVMTNTKFTDSAIELANALGVVLWDDIPFSPSSSPEYMKVLEEREARAVAKEIEEELAREKELAELEKQLKKEERIQAREEAGEKVGKFLGEQFGKTFGQKGKSAGGKLGKKLGKGLFKW